MEAEFSFRSFWAIVAELASLGNFGRQTLPILVILQVMAIFPFQRNFHTSTKRQFLLTP